MDTPDTLHAQLVAARAQLAEAHETIRQFHDLIVRDGRVEYRGLALTQGERVVLNALYQARDAISRERIRAVLDVALNRDDPGATIDTLLCHLRRKLTPLDPPVRITTLYRFGYRLDPDARKRLAALRIPPLENRHERAASAVAGPRSARPAKTVTRRRV